MLRFTPYAWAKLIWFRDRGDTEIGGFGISSAEDLMLITDFVTVKQLVTSVTVEFDDDAVADHFDAQVDAGRPPEQFARVWLHSHPGSSATPSGTDEATFERVFGQCDWAIMAIVAKGGQSYARLRFGVGPRGEMRIPIEVDYSTAFTGSDHTAWKAEYQANIHPVAFLTHNPFTGADIFNDRAWMDEFAIDDHVWEDLDELTRIQAAADEPGAA